MRRMVLASCLLPLALLAAGEVPIGIGYRHDGSGHYPDCDPPLTWNNGWTAKGSGKNTTWTESGTTKSLRWKLPMPNWSSGSPIATAGRVFAMSEPTGYAPIIICVDADSGKELWRDELDPCDAIPGGAGLKQEWAGLWALSRELLTLRAEQKAIEKLEGDAKAKALKAWEAKAGKHGITGMGFKKYSSVTVSGGNLKSLEGKVKALWQKGLYFMRHNVGISNGMVERGTWTGYTYPTPVTDGERVYVLTGYNTAACYDLTGKRLWHEWLGAPLDRKQNAGKSWHDASFYPSPVLIDGVLVCSNPGFLVGLDAETGKERWRVKSARGASGIHYFSATPLPMVIDGTACVFHADGVLYRATDGEALIEPLGHLHRNHSHAALAAGVDLPELLPRLGVDTEAADATAGSC